jgi:2-phosphosulfolactate phosphatase
MGNLNLEDCYGAGYLVDLLAERLGERTDFSDAARVARALYRSGDPYPMLRECRVGRMMAERGLEHEIEFAARRSTLQVVPRLEDGRLVTA